MRQADGTLSDLTLALNGAITELAAPITPADGTLVSATSQLRALLTWAGSSKTTDGTLAGNTSTYNAFAEPIIRLYIIPVERIILDSVSYRGPAYFDFRGHVEDGHIKLDYAAGESRAMIMMGSIDLMVFALKAAEPKHINLAGRPDVYQFPENLDTVLNAAQRTALNTYLEAHGIPGDWLQPGGTWRQNLRIIAAMFLYLQRTLSIIGNPIDPFAGLTLNTRYSQIPNPLHDAMSQAATDLGFAWEVTDNTQVRRIFKLMADQWANRQIGLGFINL